MESKYTNGTNLKEFLKVVKEYLKEVAYDDRRLYKKLRDITGKDEITDKYYLLLADVDFCKEFLEFKIKYGDSMCNETIGGYLMDFLLYYLENYFKDKGENNER